MQIDKKKTSVRVPRSRQLLERAMSKNKKKQKNPTLETVTSGSHTGDCHLRGPEVETAMN
jgi:hypothetical protein